LIAELKDVPANRGHCIHIFI